MAVDVDEETPTDAVELAVDTRLDFLDCNGAVADAPPAARRDADVNVVWIFPVVCDVTTVERV